MMVIEHPERFGLAQLHQLRGRIGRGTDPATCFVVSDAPEESVRSRLTAFVETTDGFALAEKDLELRGPGELLGTRQSGLADFRLANLARDSQLLLEARREALEWLAQDPSLGRPESRALREVLKHRWGARLELGGIG